MDNFKKNPSEVVRLVRKPIFGQSLEILYRKTRVNRGNYVRNCISNLKTDESIGSKQNNINEKLTTSAIIFIYEILRIVEFSLVTWWIGLLNDTDRYGWPCLRSD